MIACVERELGFRGRVYPRWVASGKLTQSASDLEMGRMRAVLDALKRSQIELTNREPGQLFSGEVYGPAKVRQDERARVLDALRPMVHTDVLLRLEAKLAKQSRLTPKEAHLAAEYLLNERKNAEP